MTVADSDEERLRNQIEELVTRRDYDAALRFAVREADHAYGRQRYAQGIDVLKALIQLLKDQQVVLWNIYIGAYQKIVGLDNQMGDKSATIRDLIELSRYCIKDGDFESWYQAWYATAERVLGFADECAAAGNDVSAREAYLRAATYFSGSISMIDGTDDPSRGVPAWKRHLACWEEFCSRLDAPAEKVDIPYEEVPMPGYFFKPQRPASD